MLEKSEPFKLKFSDRVKSFYKKHKMQIGDVTINLPFISFSVSPNDIEQRVAREIVIRLSDKRVLNAAECCSDCIRNAIESLIQIRKILVDKQVELSSQTESTLYLLIEMIVSAIRQFLTFTETFGSSNLNEINDAKYFNLISDFHMNRQEYLSTLEILRSHIFRCLNEISKIADITIPNIPQSMRYDEIWNEEAYDKSEFIDE